MGRGTARCDALLAFPAPAAAGARRSADSLVCEQVGEAQGSGQGHQRHHVPHAGARARPFLQRRSVSWWMSRRRAISAHDRPDSSLNRSSRSGKSWGTWYVTLLWWMRCRGMESPVLTQDGAERKRPRSTRPGALLVPAYRLSGCPSCGRGGRCPASASPAWSVRAALPAAPSRGLGCGLYRSSRMDTLKVPARKRLLAPYAEEILNSRPPTFRKWVPSWSAVKMKRVLRPSPPP